MSASGEVDDVEMPVEPKPVKEMKPKASKQTKTASHPPYFEMVKEALLALKERNGSSPYAIAKYMDEKFKPVLPANFKKILSLQLKNQTKRGKLVKIKASYKLSDAEKPKKEKKDSVAEKKQQNQKRKTNGTVGGKKKVVNKKSKSIKSTTNKRGRKANAAAA